MRDRRGGGARDRTERKGTSEGVRETVGRTEEEKEGLIRGWVERQEEDEERNTRAKEQGRG